MAAAAVAQPGDVITVHAGIYRERVTPPRGGNSDSERIIIADESIGIGQEKSLFFRVLDLARSTLPVL
jgi:hypothetical protein